MFLHMNKHLILLPCIFVYKIVYFILKIPVTVVKYVSLGTFFTLYNLLGIVVDVLFITFHYAFNGVIILSYFVYKLIKNVLKYPLMGILFVCLLLSRMLKYAVKGITVPFVFILMGLNKINNKIKVYNEKQQKRKEERILKQKMETKKRLEAKQQRIEKDKKRKEELKLQKEQRRKNEEAFVNENVKIEKKTLKDYINLGFKKIGEMPSNLVKFFKSKWENSTFVKNRRNKLDIQRQALLISFEGEDAEKSSQKLTYEYVAKNTNGKVVKGHFAAYSKVEVHSFLLSEGYEVYSIKTNKWIQFAYGGSETNTRTKIKTKDLIFFLTQLSTYIKSGIPLVEALRILSRQYKKKSYQRIFRELIYDLTMGDNFSDALTKRGEAFPRLLINMVKTSELTGELPEALDDMADYYTQADKTKRQMITAMMYPTIVFVISIAVITFIMMFVVPKFVEIYADMDADQIPGITIFVISVSEFLEKYIIWVFVALIVLILIYSYLYKKVKVFKTVMQWIAMHLPGFGNVIIYNEVTMFTKTFASLLKHNVFITESMEILNKITNNEIYKMLILDTITNLARGDKISLAFQNHWAFPIPAYEMLVTGEKTGQLPEMMGKVADYYQGLHEQAVARIKTLIEPVLIVFLTVMVGIIVLAVVLPMLSMYQTVQMQ